MLKASNWVTGFAVESSHLRKLHQFKSWLGLTSLSWCGETQLQYSDTKLEEGTTTMNDIMILGHKITIVRTPSQEVNGGRACLQIGS